MMRPAPRSTLFPYTTLFRSARAEVPAAIRLRVEPFVSTAAGSIVAPSTDRTPRLKIAIRWRSEEHTSELQSRFDLVCRLLLEKKKEQIILGLRRTTSFLSTL